MISIVIPAFDEEDAIGETIGKVRSTLADAGLSGEVIVVDDGSSDRTAEIALAAGARVVNHPCNVGYGRSLKDGIDAAQFDTIVITDADGTYPVDQIPVLLTEYEKGFDMVVGARTGAHYRESALKSPLRMILKILVEFTAGRTIPDINSGLRIFSRDTSKAYFNHLCETFSFTTSLTLAYVMTGRFVKYLPVPYHKRIGKTKVRLFRDSLRTLQYILEAILYWNPLKAFILMSGLCLGGAAISFLAALVTHIALPYFVGTGLVLLSVLVFCLGLLAAQLRQIMEYSATKPLRPGSANAPKTSRD